MTERISLSRDDLSKLLNKEIQSYKGCENLKIGIFLLREMDADGCNWVRGNVVTATGVPEGFFSPIVEKAVSDISAKYNIERSN